MIHSGRGWAGDILFEFWMPKMAPQKAFILLDGMPTVPSKRYLGDFLATKGYAVFHMRYRGSWESKGEFLKDAPDKDVRILIDHIEKGFTAAFNYHPARFKLRLKSIYVLGASFGGATSILASRDPRVTKAIALAPLINWNIQSKVEPLQKLPMLIASTFGSAYRAPKKNWAKLGKKGFFNPIDHVDEVDGDKLLIIHEKGDMICPSAAAKVFAAATDATYIERRGDTHFSLTQAMDPVIWKHIKQFIS